MGKSTDKKSGVTGSSVPGCRTGAGWTGLSALMLYQNFGRSLSFKRNRVWSVISLSFGVIGRWTIDDKGWSLVLRLTKTKTSIPTKGRTLLHIRGATQLKLLSAALEAL